MMGCSIQSVTQSGPRQTESKDRHKNALCFSNCSLSAHGLFDCIPLVKFVTCHLQSRRCTARSLADLKYPFLHCVFRRLVDRKLLTARCFLAGLKEACIRRVPSRQSGNACGCLSAKDSGGGDERGEWLLVIDPSHRRHAFNESVML